MTTWLATMGGVDYDDTVGRTMDLAPSRGVDRIRVYDDVWLKTHPFYQVNRWLFEAQPQVGFGWHAWKPLIVLDTMRLAAAGDVVGYLDGDTYPTGRDLRPLYETASREGAMLFGCQGQPHRKWCRRDCYLVMGQDEPRYHDAPHGCARFGFWKKGDWKAEQFLYEWLTYCCNPLANTRTVREPLKPELPGFTGEDCIVSEHRTDQAIYTLLTLKFGYRQYQEASCGGPEGPPYFEQAHVTRGNNPGCGSRWRNVEDP